MLNEVQTFNVLFFNLELHSNFTNLEGDSIVNGMEGLLATSSCEEVTTQCAVILITAGCP